MPAPLSFPRQSFGRHLPPSSSQNLRAARDQNPACALVGRVAAIGLPERARKEIIVLGLAALALAARSANATASFTTAAPWWERITYTLRDDGAQQACKYESSLGGVESCGDEDLVAPAEGGGSTPGSFTKLTFERRFDPGLQPREIKLAHGDTFLGGHVMALAFDGAGLVRSCRVVATSGKLQTGYGCDEVRAERFQASAGRNGDGLHQGFMTILVYGHEEQLA